MYRFLFLLAFLLPAAFAFTPVEDACTTCATPANVTKTNETASSISFAWSATDGATGYVLEYLKQGESTPVRVTTSSMAHTFSGLAAGTYTFSFRADCGGVVSQEFIVIDDVAGN